MRRVAQLVVVILILLAATAGPAHAAHCGARGDTYAEALAAKAAARAAAAREARLAAARAREARRDAAAVEKYSRIYGSQVGRWAPLVRDYFPGHVAEAMYVIAGESRGDPHADNGVCRGLFQLHECHAEAFRRVVGRSYFWAVFDARANIHFAAHMTGGGRDWSAWSVRP